MKTFQKYSIPILAIFGVFLLTFFVFFKDSVVIKSTTNSFRFIEETENPKSIDVPSKSPVTKKLIYLMYHYVEINQNKADFKRDSLNTNPYIFEQQMVTLKNAGYKFIKPSEIKEFLDDKSDQKYVVVSFDDGYRTFFSYTYPIIKKYGIKSVNYIIYNFIGRQNNMDEWQIKELVKDDLVEIGSHTLNHPNLTEILPDQLKSEIIDSKNLLEKRFGINVTSFCYPYGYYNEKAFPFIKEAGYLTAVTTKEGSMISEDNLYEIKRIRPGIYTGQALLEYLDKIN